MEMDSNKKQNGSLRVIVRLSVMLLALVVMVVSFAYSWFFFGTNADVSNMEMSVADAYNLLVKSDGDTEWKKVLRFDFDEDFVLKAVAGDGRSFFTTLRELQKIEDPDVDFGRYGYVTTGYESIASAAWRDSGVFAYDFSFMIEHDCDLQFTGASSATPAVDEEGNEISPESMLAPVSTGAVVGAVRVAFLKWDGSEYQLQAIWIPDVTTEFVNNNGQYSVITDGTPVKSVFVSAGEGGSAVEYTVDTDNTDTNTDVQDGITYVWGPLADAEDTVTISTLSANEENKFRMVIWLDGNDRECQNALLEGIVTLKMKFAVEDIPQAEE